MVVTCDTDTPLNIINCIWIVLTMQIIIIIYYQICVKISFRYRNYANKPNKRYESHSTPALTIQKNLSSKYFKQDILTKLRNYNVPTSVSFWRGAKAATNDLGLGLSLGSYCKHRDAKRTSSVPSLSENCPSKQESVNICRFLSRIKSRACIKFSNN